MSISREMANIQAVYWHRGYEAGLQEERARIIRAMKKLAASRDVFETLKYPFLADELEEAIMDGEDFE